MPQLDDDTLISMEETKQLKLILELARQSNTDDLAIKAIEIFVEKDSNVKLSRNPPSH